VRFARLERLSFLGPLIRIDRGVEELSGIFVTVFADAREGAGGQGGS
jgi:hypothetical protein